MSYNLKIKDCNQNEIIVLKTKSQVEMDSFTSFFINEKQFLKNLKLDEDKFKVIIERKYQNRLFPMKFIGKNNRELIYLDNNYIDKLVEKVSSYDRERISEFVNNEFLILEDRDNTDFYKNKRVKLKKVYDLLELDEKKQKQNINNYVTNIELHKAIRNSLYYKNELYNYNKPDYSMVKRLYLFMYNLGVRFDFIKNKELVEKEEKSKKEGQILFNTIKEKVNQYLNKETNIFNVDNKKENIIIDNSIEELDDIDEKYIDIDDKIKELDIYMDHYKMDEEEKHNYLNKILK